MFIFNVLLTREFHSPKSQFTIKVKYQCLFFNVLLTRKFCSPKSQFVKYQCLFSMYYHYANSTVLSCNSQNVNVCVLSMYYHVLLMYFPREREGSLTAKSHYFQISDHRQRTPGNWRRINQILRNLPTAPANYVKFTESIPMASNLEVIPVNSRKIQRTTQIPRCSHNTSANHAKFATFANNRQDKLRTSYTYCTYFTAYILHAFCTIVD